MKATIHRHTWAALLAATALATPAWSQEASTTTGKANPLQVVAADAPAPPDASEVVVTGFRRSYADAIRSKRNEVAITDGISSDGLGRFPDLNVGEALQRVPGVQINREAEGRNATINLRGLPGEYSKMTLNGVAFAEPILTDATPLGAFNSDIFSAIVIDKSPLADTQSGGLSGNVDLQIAPALGRKEGGFAKASLEYNELGKRKAPAFTVGYNHHFSDNFAVFGVLAFKHENFRRDTIQFNSYSPFSATQAQANASVLGAYYPTSAVCTACTGTTSTKGVLYNSQLRQYTRTNVGNLLTGAAGAEWKADDHLTLGLTGFYTSRRLPNTTQYLQITDNNDQSIMSGISAPIQLSDGRYVSTDYSFANAQSRMSTRRYSQYQKTWGVDAKADWQNDNWHLTSIATLSRANNNSLETEFDWDRLQVNGGNNGVTGTIHTGAGDIGAYSYSLLPDPATTTVVPNGWYWGGVSDPTQWYDSATTANRRIRMQVTGTQSYAENQLAAWQGDAERTFENSVLSGIRVGVRYEHNKFISQGYRTSAYGIQTQNIDGNFERSSPSVNGFFGGTAPGYSTNWQATNIDYALSKLLPVTVYPGGALSPLGFNIRYNDNSYSLYNFSNQTDLAIGYAQLKYEFELGGIRIRGNGGLRYEHANNKVVALDRTTLTGTIGAPSDFKEHTYKQSYNKLLPSFIMVADLTDKLVLRGAAYKTYVRPQPRQFTPSTIINDQVNGVVSATLGNPDLKPYSATSFDLSAEWYNRPNGIVSLAAFQKRITGLITQINDPKQLCPSDLSVYGVQNLGTFSVEGDKCQSNLNYPGTGQPYVFAASGFVNQDRAVTLRGLEFNVQQTLDFLPGMLRHLGGGFNYAYTKISGTNANGTKATLPGVSKHNANVIGYYETDDYGLRLVYNMRSKYDLASAGTFTGAARSVKARGQLDLSASYNLSKSLTLSFDAYNLTNAIRQEYENDTRLARRVDYDGRTYTLTARATF